MLKPYLFVADTHSKGRGVFTRERIPAHTIVEIAPVIVMALADREHLDKTLLHDYIFEWGKPKNNPDSPAAACAMALGLVPVYNHSYQSNCEYFMDYDDQTILIKTVRVIENGEELTINYNGDWDDEKKVWFDVK